MCLAPQGFYCADSLFYRTGKPVAKVLRRFIVEELSSVYDHLHVHDQYTIVNIAYRSFAHERSVAAHYGADGRYLNGQTHR